MLKKCFLKTVKLLPVSLGYCSNAGFECGNFYWVFSCLWRCQYGARLAGGLRERYPDQASTIQAKTWVFLSFLLPVDPNLWGRGGGVTVIRITHWRNGFTSWSNMEGNRKIRVAVVVLYDTKMHSHSLNLHFYEVWRCESKLNPIPVVGKRESQKGWWAIACLTGRKKINPPLILPLADALHLVRRKN